LTALRYREPLGEVAFCVWYNYYMQSSDDYQFNKETEMGTNPDVFNSWFIQDRITRLTSDYDEEEIVPEEGADECVEDDFNDRDDR
jgi:hypothetical protein